jgi:hypothetical protein
MLEPYKLGPSSASCAVYLPEHNGRSGSLRALTSLELLLALPRKPPVDAASGCALGSAQSAVLTQLTSLWLDLAASQTPRCLSTHCTSSSYVLRLFHLPTRPAAGCRAGRQLSLACHPLLIHLSYCHLLAGLTQLRHLMLHNVSLGGPRRYCAFEVVVPTLVHLEVADEDANYLGTGATHGLNTAPPTTTAAPSGCGSRQ